MKTHCHWLATALLSLSCDAAQIAYEPFGYEPAAPLTGLSGGDGWLDAWFADGQSVSTASFGLEYVDSFGNLLKVSGRCANTAGNATTRSLRNFQVVGINNVWISFLYQLPASNSKFEGVSFYLGTQGVFSISNPSTTTSPAIYLTNNWFANSGVNTGQGAFGQTHLIVLKLTKGAGAGGVDRIQAFIDPVLSAIPTVAVATLDGSNFDFDRVRFAGQDGSPLWVDELRVGESFAEVAPFVSPGSTDSDGDGLSDAREAVLGLDPLVPDTALIAGIQAHPDWFGLYRSSGILGLGKGGVVVSRNSDEPVNFIFEVQQSANLTQWGVLETITRSVPLPSGKNFLRVTLHEP